MAGNRRESLTERGIRWLSGLTDPTGDNADIDRVWTSGVSCCVISPDGDRLWSF